jgi:hypothetical protein
VDVNEDNVALTGLSRDGVNDSLGIDFPEVKFERHRYFRSESASITRGGRVCTTRWKDVRNGSSATDSTMCLGTSWSGHLERGRLESGVGTLTLVVPGYPAVRLRLRRE